MSQPDYESLFKGYVARVFADRNIEADVDALWIVAGLESDNQQQIAQRALDQGFDILLGEIVEKLNDPSDPITADEAQAQRGIIGDMRRAAMSRLLALTANAAGGPKVGTTQTRARFDPPYKYGNPNSSRRYGVPPWLGGDW